MADPVYRHVGTDRTAILVFLAEAINTGGYPSVAMARDVFAAATEREATELGSARFGSINCYASDCIPDGYVLVVPRG